MSISSAVIVPTDRHTHTDRTDSISKVFLFYLQVGILQVFFIFSSSGALERLMQWKREPLTRMTSHSDLSATCVRSPGVPGMMCYCTSPHQGAAATLMCFTATRGTSYICHSVSCGSSSEWSEKTETFEKDLHLSNCITIYMGMMGSVILKMLKDFCHCHTKRGIGQVWQLGRVRKTFFKLTLV